MEPLPKYTTLSCGHLAEIISNWKQHKIKYILDQKTIHKQIVFLDLFATVLLYFSGYCRAVKLDLVDFVYRGKFRIL